jgi:hypothetical protein
MERSTVRKVIRAASLSLLLATATGVAGVEIVGASPAVADPAGAGSNPAPAPGSDPTDPPVTPTPSPTPAPGGLPGVGGVGGLGLPSVP